MREEEFCLWPWLTPKPSLVERLFAEQRGALQTFFGRRILSKADAPDLAGQIDSGRGARCGRVFVRVEVTDERIVVSHK